MQTKTITKVL